MNKKEVVSLLASGLAIAGGVYAVPLAGLVLAQPEILGEGLKALGGLGGNLFANALQSKLIDSHPQDDILKNGDLTRAIGKAIFALCGKYAEEIDNQDDKNSLIKLSQLSLETWENLILGGGYVDGYGLTFSKIDLDEIAAEKSVKFLTAKSENLDSLTALTPETWKNIIAALYKNERFSLSLTTKEGLAEKLHKEFPKTLKQILVDDFSKDGKAFASMQFRLLGEILTYTQVNFAYAQQNFNLSNEMLPLVVELSRNVDEIKNNSPRYYSNENKLEWKPAFEKFDVVVKKLDEILKILKDNQFDIKKILKTIDENQNLGKESYELLEKIFNAIKSNKTSKSLKTTFYPKNFPERLTYFTGRENVLEKIAEALKLKGKAALADTHGIGKSSVIIEFAHRNKDSFKHIFFIRATANEFYTFVSEIVYELGFVLPNDAPPQVRLETLQKWLAENEDWLLLIDNVDDVEFIKNCNFNKPTGKVIYTSNDDKIYKVGTAVDIPKMSVENAMLLLYKHWQDKAEAEFADIPEKYHSTLKQIAEDFGNHPFSMAFVGSYLADEDESREEFLKAYQKKEKNLLANYQFLSNYQHKSVATAFLLRFEQISTPKDESEREKFLSIAVQDYLKFSAFIGTDNIPEELLQQSLAKLHPDLENWTMDEEFIKDIYKRFKPTSIFKRNAEEQTLNTHRIVKEIMRFQIKDEEDLILSVLAYVLADNFEHFDFTNKEKVERYLSHIGIFLEYLEENKPNDSTILKIEQKSTALLCNSYARYFEEYGDYMNAEKYYAYFKQICERVEEIDETWQATSYNNLALLYYSQGRYEEAEPYHLKALAIREKVSGTEHIDTANSYNNLALLYESQGKYEEAEPYHLKTLEIREKVLGENHPHTANSYNNLAVLYESQGKYEEAETYNLKTLAINEKVLGENHPHRALSYNNLAVLYQSQGKYEEAEPYHLKALAINEKVLGENHPHRALSYNNLALLYQLQGKYKEAEPYYLKALAIREKVLGEKHPSTATIYYNLGVFYAKHGKFKDTKEYIEKALSIWTVKLGENHPNTTSAKESLQNVIKDMQDSEK